MIEQHSIEGKNVWIKVDAHPVERKNPNIIPTEYFTATCYTENPNERNDGNALKDDEGEIKLYESPVAALTAARKYLENQFKTLGTS